MNFLLIVVDEYDLNDDDEQQVMMLMIQVLILKNLLNELMRYLNFDDVLKINSDVEMSTKTNFLEINNLKRSSYLQNNG